MYFEYENTVFTTVIYNLIEESETVFGTW